MKEKKMKQKGLYENDVDGDKMIKNKRNFFYINFLL